MSKAFTKEPDASDDDEGVEAKPLPLGTKNYITPSGAKRLKDELHELLTIKRPELTAVVAWAASNGDRSENADYIYGKRKLREYDRRIRFLEKRIEAFEIIDPATVQSDKVVFGATVTIVEEDGEKTFSIVGIDESVPERGLISWISPLARALLQKRVGDEASFQSPRGLRDMEVIKIEFLAIDTKPTF